MARTLALVSKTKGAHMSAFMRKAQPATFRLCDGRRMKHRWIKAGGGFGCPVNRRYMVHRGLHTHRLRGAHFVTRASGHKHTTRAEFFRKAEVKHGW